MNLADPSFEPTDDQLQGLSIRAYAGVRAARVASMERLRKAIAVERTTVLEWLETMTRGGPA